MKFYDRLKELRIEKGLSQMQLANATGLSQSAIARWELKITDPPASSLITLAKFFGVTVDYLLGLEDY